MGESREREGFFGDKYIEHHDDDGNKIGESREREGVFGDKYTEHRDANWNKTGESREREGVFGDKYSEHRDTNWNKTGESREREGFFGDKYTEHRDANSNKTGESREREGVFGNRYTEHTGSGWRSSPRETEYVQSSSSSGSGLEILIGWLIGAAVVVGIVIALVIFVIWLVVNVALPLLLLNSALALTILACVYKDRRTLFAAFSLVGGGYLLIDVFGGWFSALFVNNVVGNPVWVTCFAYLNAAAVGLSVWFLVQPMWASSLEVRDSDRNRSMMLMGGSIALVVAAVVFIPLVYHLIPNQLGLRSNNSSTFGTPGNRSGTSTNTGATEPNGRPALNLDTSLSTRFDRIYGGAINAISFSMSLVRHETKLEGQASTPSKTDTLSGTIDSYGNFEMKGYENGKKFTGIYKGTIDIHGEINGTWTKPNGTKETSFYVSQSQ